MKQLQSQMEAEMRMKTELVRHQMQILSEVQSDSDFNEVISRFAGKEIILKITQNVAFEFWHFPPIFVLLKLTCLVTLFNRKLLILAFFRLMSITKKVTPKK